MNRLHLPILHRGILPALLLLLLLLTATLRAQFAMAPPAAPVLSNQTGLFHQPVQVTNTGTQPRNDLRLFVTGLVAPVVLHNATGTLNNTPYLDYITPIAGGATATVELRYYDPTLRMQNTPTVSVGSSNPAVELAITAPADQARLVTSPSNVTGTNSPGVNAITVNGRPATIAGTTWSIQLPLHQGTNIITATATGSTGQMRSATRTVFLESAPATIAVAFPADGSRVTESSIAVSGVINDVVPGTINAGQITVTVNGIAARVANRSFSLVGVPLQPGLNSIVVIGTDPEGNTSTQTVRVTYLPPAGNAVIQMVSGNDQSAVIGQELPQPLTVRVQGADGNPVANVPVAFRIKCNDGTLRDGARSARALVVNSNASGQASVRWVLGNRSGVGCNVVEVTATGYAGRTDFIAEALLGPAAQINVEANNNQVGQTGQPLRQPLTVVVIDAGSNRKQGVPVTFTVTEGGGVFDNGQATFTTNTNSDGRASVRLVLGPADGLDNNRVTANFPGNPGPAATFVATGLTPGPPANTAVSGVVLDNTDQPIEGVTLSISGTALTTTSNAQGQFRLQGVPVGHVQFTANGSTTTRPGAWPTLEYELTTVSGRDNTLGMPIYLLPLDLGNGVPVDETRGGVLTLPNFPGFKLEIAPGSVTFPGGARSGLISVTAVHADRVPMTPGFGQQPRFIVTVQPANAIFDPPARLTLPNTDSLPPGAITEMYSFDHDIRQFVAIGTGHVSEEGSVIISDPGIGIVKAGWHCGGNPQEVAAGITSTVTVDKATVDVQVDATEQVTATGNPTPPHDSPFEWVKDFNDAAGAAIPTEDRGDATLTPAPTVSGNSSTASIKGVKCGKVGLKVRYRCKSAQWSAWKRIVIEIPRIEIQVNNTATFDDDVVQLRCERPVTRYKVNGRARVTGNPPADLTAVLTNPDSRLRFPEEANTSKTLTLPRDGTWVAFEISGQSASAALEDAIIEAHVGSAGGELCGKRKMTVFWFDEGKMDLTAAGAYTVRNTATQRIVENTTGLSISFAASARIRPAGIDCTKARQISDLRVSVLQNINFVDADVYDTPAITWNGGVAAGTTVTVPTTITSTTTSGWVNDTDAASAPVYDRGATYLQPPVGCPSAADATGNDTPRSVAALTLTVPARDGTGAAVGSITYQLNRLTSNNSFRTWAVIYNTRDNAVCTVRENTWVINMNSANAAAGTPTAGTSAAPANNPITGAPYANDVANDPAARVQTTAGTTTFTR